MHPREVTITNHPREVAITNHPREVTTINLRAVKTLHPQAEEITGAAEVGAHVQLPVTHC
jgi:hypothetical protein